MSLKIESRNWINLLKLNPTSRLDFPQEEQSLESPIKDGIAPDTCSRTDKNLVDKAYNYFKLRSFFVFRCFLKAPQRFLPPPVQNGWTLIRLINGELVATADKTERERKKERELSTDTELARLYQQAALFGSLVFGKTRCQISFVPCVWLIQYLFHLLSYFQQSDR